MRIYLGRYRYCKYDVIECKNLLNNTREYLKIHPDLYYFGDDESDDYYVKSNGISYGISISRDSSRLIEFYTACIYKNGSIEYKYKSFRKMKLKIGFIDSNKLGPAIII